MRLIDLTLMQEHTIEQLEERSWKLMRIIRRVADGERTPGNRKRGRGRGKRETTE